MFIERKNSKSSFVKRILLFRCSVVSDSFLTPMGCSRPGSSVHGIFQTRILEWIAISFSRGTSQPRDWTHSSWIGRSFTLNHQGREFTPRIIFPVSPCGSCWIFVEWDHLPPTASKDQVRADPFWNLTDTQELGSYWICFPIQESERGFQDHRKPGWGTWGFPPRGGWDGVARMPLVEKCICPVLAREEVSASCFEVTGKEAEPWRDLLPQKLIIMMKKTSLYWMLSWC